MLETIFVPRGPEEMAVRRGLARAGSSARVVPTGIGRLSATAAVDAARAERAFETAFVTGLCGLLSPAFAVGDALVYRTIVREGEPPVALDRGLGDAVASRFDGAQSGIRGIESTAVVTTATEKAALAERCAVDAVDMESFALAQRLHEAGVRVAIARVGSDAAGDELPALQGAIDGAGRLARWRLMAAMLRRPIAGARLASNGIRALGALQRMVRAVFGSDGAT